MVEAKEATIYKTLEAGEEIPATSTQEERVISWMGFQLNKRRLSLSGESVSIWVSLKSKIFT